MAKAHWYQCFDRTQRVDHVSSKCLPWCISGLSQWQTTSETNIPGQMIGKIRFFLGPSLKSRWSFATNSVFMIIRHE